MNRTNRTKYTAYLLSLISVCSGLAKINAMDNSSNLGENININIKNLDKVMYLWNTEEGFQCTLYNNGHLVINSGSNTDGVLKNVFGERQDDLRKKVKSVSFEGNIREIGFWAFYECKNLKSVTIPETVIRIGEGAFANCTSLTFIDIPNSVTKIGKRAFANCTSLPSIMIPNSVRTISDYAFWNCESLISIHMPETAFNELGFEIGRFAFAHCKSLVEIDVSSAMLIDDVAFGGCNSLIKVDMPERLKKLYLELHEYNSTWDYWLKLDESSKKNPMESPMMGVGVKMLAPEIGYCSVGKHLFKDCNSLTAKFKAQYDKLYN